MLSTLASTFAMSPISFGVLWLIITAVCFCSYVAYNLWFHPMRDVPGPFIAKLSPLWIMSTLWRRKLSPDLSALHERYGPIVRVAPNEISFGTVDSLDIIYHGPNPKAGYFSKQGTLQDIITNFILPGPNIITMHDRIAHRKLKSRLEPAFTPKALFQQEFLVSAHIKAMCCEIDSSLAKGQNVINITESLSGMLWHMVSDLAFGESMVDGLRKPFERFVENCTGMFQVVESLNLFLPLIGRPLRLVLEALPYPFTSGHIIQAKRLRACMAKTHERRDFLTAIMEDQKATGLTLTDRELQSNSAALFMAGYGTTAISISGILYQLLREPSHLRRLQDELCSTFKHPDEIDGPALQHLPYLNACIQESLRLIPAINTRFAGRTSPGATISGLYVPAGVAVFSDVYTIQRSDAYWAQAKHFRPERWLPHEKGSPYESDVKAAFKPFLLGTRACVGKQMALQVLRLALAHLLMRYDMVHAGEAGIIDWETEIPSSLVWTDYRRITVQLSKRDLS